MIRFPFSPPVEAAFTVGFGLLSLQGIPSLPSGPNGTVGLLVGGIAFACYWIVRAIMPFTSKGATVVNPQTNVDVGGPATWVKMQEVLDTQKNLHQTLIDALKDLHEEVLGVREAVDNHASYIREKAAGHTKELAQDVGEIIAPLLVNSIRGSFDAERVSRAAEVVAEAKTQQIKRKTKRRK